MTTPEYQVRTAAQRLPASPREKPVEATAETVGLTIQRSIGNDYLRRSADCAEPANKSTTDKGCDGGCGGCAMRAQVQAMLRVGPVGDPAEQEADRVADQVAGSNGRPPRERRKADTAPGASAPTVVLPTGGGRALSATTRAFMEPRFGVDFGDVRLHTGHEADRAAASIHARAFTHGRDVYLRGDESEHDHRLMAHELTHIVQQRGGARAVRRAPAKKPKAEPAGDGELKATRFGSVTIDFDGAEAVVRGDGREIFRFSAQSGRPVRLSKEDAEACGADPDIDTYMNDKRFVGIKDFGPIPEGSYTLSPPAIQRFDFGERLKLELGGIFGMDTVSVQGSQIHAGDWGDGRVVLIPRGRLRQGVCGDVHKRSGFFLHGGLLAGSSGCIDIGGDFATLADFLGGYRKAVVVNVEYRVEPSTVGFFTGLSGALAYQKFQLGHRPLLGLGMEFGPTGTRGVASLGYDALLQWAGGALSAGVRLDVPFDDREAFVRFGLRGGLDGRLFGPLHLRLFGGYGWESGGTERSGAEVGGGLRLDLDRVRLEAMYNLLRPAAEDQRVHQALLGIGFRF
jgi:Domain of unknown function (DUF4157)